MTEPRIPKNEPRGSILSLPEELIEKICQILSDTTQSENPLNNLNNLCRTSKLLDRIARPFLYRNVGLTGSKELYTFTECVIRHPDLARIVRSLTIEYVGGDTFDDLNEGLCEKLKSLYVSNTGDNSHVVSSRIDKNCRDWVFVVKELLSRVEELTDLTIKGNGSRFPEGSFSEELIGECTATAFKGLLPSLQNVTVHNLDGLGDIVPLIRSLSRDGVRSVTCIDCGTAGGIPGDVTVVTSQLPSVRTVRCFNDSSKICPLYMPALVRSCPHLEEFHFAIADTDDDIDQDEDIDEDVDADKFSCRRILDELQHLKATLKRLSITTETWGNEEGFPSLREFKVLKHLRLDVFEIADYMNEGEDDDSEDSASDHGIANSQDHDMQPETPGAHDPDWQDIDSDGDESSDDDSKCDPILHLLPTSLTTLWIDNLYTLDGDLDDELIKLAKSAKADFTHLKRVTIEGAEEIDRESCDTLEHAFQKAGIEFVRKPLHHFWFVEEGLAEFREPDSEIEDAKQDMVESILEKLGILDPTDSDLSDHSGLD